MIHDWSIRRYVYTRSDVTRGGRAEGRSDRIQEARVAAESRRHVRQITNSESSPSPLAISVSC